MGVKTGVNGRSQESIQSRWQSLKMDKLFETKLPPARQVLPLSVTPRVPVRGMRGEQKLARSCRPMVLKHEIQEQLGAVASEQLLRHVVSAARQLALR
jgi:hypothetical protein